MTETRTVVTPAAAPHPAAGETLRFRPDIQGLRAIAVLLVVLFHAGVPGLDGGYLGVDVFLVISGFLLTARMVREVDRTGHLSLLPFLGRRAGRLLPAAAVVLLATTLASYRWLGSAPHLDGASPLHHLWAVVVAAVFTMAWPALLLLLLWLGFRWALPLWLALAVAVSFAYSVGQGGSTGSFFSPAARAWEFGAGCLLALAGDRLDRIPRPIATAGAGVGLALIVVAALTYDAFTVFPGYAAALPVLATVLVLAGRGDAVLGAAPLQWLGRLSYSFYLWHWPVLVIAELAHGEPLPGRARFVLVMVSLALSVFTYVGVEEPFRRRRSGALV